MFNAIKIVSFNIIPKRSFSTFTTQELKKFLRRIQSKQSLVRVMTSKDKNLFDLVKKNKPRWAGEIDEKGSRIKEPKIIKNAEEAAELKEELLKEIEQEENNSGPQAKTETKMFKETSDSERERIAEEKLAEVLYRTRQMMESQNVVFDTTNLYVTTRDSFRVDVGLIIQRPPIFMSLSDTEIEWMKYRLQFMNKYYMDMKQTQTEMNKLTPSTAEYFRRRDERMKENLDNFSTHRLKQEDGTYLEYCAASRHYTKADPYIMDTHSIQYAGENRVFMIVRDKKTKEWRFPTTPITYGKTLLRAKHDFFTEFTDGEWRIQFMSPNPLLSTVRKFRENEKEEDEQNNEFQGVRSFYFSANHFRGVPWINDKMYDDFAWVPKAEMNKFLSEEYYNSLIGILRNK